MVVRTIGDGGLRGLGYGVGDTFENKRLEKIYADGVYAWLDAVSAPATTEEAQDINPLWYAATADPGPVALAGRTYLADGSQLPAASRNDVVEIFENVTLSGVAYVAGQEARAIADVPVNDPNNWTTGPLPIQAVSIEVIKDATPYAAEEFFWVTIPAVGGPFIDAQAKTIQPGTTTAAFYVTGQTSPADTANLTPAEFLLMTVAEGRIPDVQPLADTILTPTGGIYTLVKSRMNVLSGAAVDGDKVQFPTAAPYTGDELVQIVNATDKTLTLEVLGPDIAVAPLDAALARKPINNFPPGARFVGRSNGPNHWYGTITHDHSWNTDAMSAYMQLGFYDGSDVAITGQTFATGLDMTTCEFLEISFEDSGSDQQPWQLARLDLRGVPRNTPKNFRAMTFSTAYISGTINDFATGSITITDHVRGMNLRSIATTAFGSTPFVVPTGTVVGGECTLTANVAATPKTINGGLTATIGQGTGFEVQLELAQGEHLETVTIDTGTVSSVDLRRGRVWVQVPAATANAAITYTVTASNVRQVLIADIPATVHAATNSLLAGQSWSDIIASYDYLYSTNLEVNAERFSPSVIIPTSEILAGRAVLIGSGYGTEYGHIKFPADLNDGTFSTFTNDPSHLKLYGVNGNIAIPDSYLAPAARTITLASGTYADGTTAAVALEGLASEVTVTLPVGEVIDAAIPPTLSAGSVVIGNARDGTLKIVPGAADATLTFATTPSSDGVWIHVPSLTLGAVTTAPSLGTTDRQGAYMVEGKRLSVYGYYDTEAGTGSTNGSGVYLIPMSQFGGGKIDLTGLRLATTHNGFRCSRFGKVFYHDPSTSSSDEGALAVYDEDNLAFVFSVRSGSAANFWASNYGSYGQTVQLFFEATSIPLQ